MNTTTDQFGDTEQNMEAMATASTSCPHPSLRKNYVVSSSRPPLRSFSRQSSFFGSKIPKKRLSLTDKTRPNQSGIPNRLGPNPTCSSSSQAFDVVVIGAGIIGLTIARELLLGSDLSVAVVDKAVPCSGATGAGTPSSPISVSLINCRKNVAKYFILQWPMCG